MSMKRFPFYVLLLSAGLFSACSNQTVRVPPGASAVNPGSSGGNNIVTGNPGQHSNSSGLGNRSGVNSNTLGANRSGGSSRNAGGHNRNAGNASRNTGRNFPQTGRGSGQRQGSGGVGINNQNSQWNGRGRFPGGSGNYAGTNNGQINRQNIPSGQSGGFNGGSLGNNNINNRQNGSFTPADLQSSNNLLAQRVLYFDYDQARIKPQYYPALDAHAQLLKNYPSLSIRLEGHADERGSRAYNVALSEQRGFSVLDYLLVKGVKRSQLDVVGYGEEIPASLGATERSWSRNRRVEIVYPGR